MVRIVNGEIVQDDDVRQQGKAQASAPASREPSSTERQQAEPSNTTPFWQRQPFKIRWDAPPVWGLQLPAIEVFEIFVPAQQLLIAAALGLAFGWRIVLFLAIVFVVVKINSAPSPPPQQAARSGPGVAADFLRDYMATNPSKPSSAAAQNLWSTRGKGQKLGSA